MLFMMYVWFVKLIISQISHLIYMLKIKKKKKTSENHRKSMKLDIHTSHNMKSTLISGSIFVPRASSFRGSGASGRSMGFIAGVLKEWGVAQLFMAIV